jgi:hypothetical protein
MCFTTNKKDQSKILFCYFRREREEKGREGKGREGKGREANVRNQGL